MIAVVFGMIKIKALKVEETYPVSSSKADAPDTSA
jgi:hypothetical protein